VRLIPKQIWKEEFDYYSEKSVEGLKADIQQLLEKTKGWNFSVNLTGEFTSEFEFQMTPKWQLVVIMGFERKISYLKGHIFLDEFKRTRVTFTVRPNSIFLIFFFLFPMFGIIALATAANKDAIDEARILGFILTFVAPALIVAFGHFAKQGIKTRFIETFDLKPIR
jgi:hypothetical protein